MDGRRDRAPLVSIVLPTYNGERYLREAIDSCLKQTHPCLELLVVDDGSRVDVRPIIEAAADPRVRYLRHAENQGLPTALNTGFAASRGEYLTWTSDDNRYHPQAIARMVEYLERHPEVGLVYTGVRLLDEAGAPGELFPPPPPETVWVQNCVRACFLYRRQVFDRVGPYDPEVPLVEDYDYWLRTARLFRLARLDEILYDLRAHTSSLTATLSLERKCQSHLKVLAKLRDGALGPVPSSAIVRRARAAMDAVYGRAYFFTGETGRARHHLWAAVLWRPSNLLRWLVLGPLLKSLLGDRVLSRLRAFRMPGPAASASKALRILHCCGQFAVTQGGTERQARAVCDALAARGHHVSVLARESRGPEEVVPGVRLHAKIRVIDRGRLFGITYLGSATWHLLCEAKRADVLHAHHLYLDALASLAVGRIRRSPVVAKMVGAGPGGDLDRVRQTAGGWLFLRLLRALDAVIAPSPTCRAELTQAGFAAERIHVIANGVDLGYFHPDVGLEPTPPFSLHGGPMVAFTGRLMEAKGLLELLDAWRLVLGEFPGARLCLVGSGPLEAELRRRIAHPPLAARVDLVGEVADVRPYLRAASAFAFPSWAEGLPNALLEAMAMRLPCVASDIGPIRDAMRDGQEGMLVPVRAPDRLAGALITILSQPDLAARLGHAARRRVEAEFSLEREVDRLEALYRGLRPPRRHGVAPGAS
jgi:glycosyltransferase involved in cell wall biosynthesis